MRTAVIHVGMPKTGSTTIQSALRGYDKDGTVFLTFRSAPPQYALQTIFSKDPYKVGMHVRAGTSKAKVDELRTDWRAQLDDISRQPCDTLIVSNELFVNLTAPELIDCATYFQEHFDRVRFLAYVRPPRSYCQSLFQEHVKHGLNDFRFRPPQYRKMFTKLVRNFDANDLTFVKFDRESLVGGDVLADFCHRVGIPAGTVSAPEKNVGLGLEACCLLYAHNKLADLKLGSPELVQARQRLKSLLAGIPGKKLQIDQNLIDGLVSKEGVAWMERIGGFSLAEPDADIEKGEMITSESQVLDIAMQALPEFRKAAADAIAKEIGEVATPQDAQTAFLKFHLAMMA